MMNSMNSFPFQKKDSQLQVFLSNVAKTTPLKEEIFPFNMENIFWFKDHLEQGRHP
jgi:hypothetical protein